MDIYQAIYIAAALSLPLVTLLAIARGSIGVYRLFRANRKRSAIIAIFAIIVILCVFSYAVVVWFIYAVSHGHKDTQTDLMLLAMTGIPVYASAVGAWQLGVYLEKRMKKERP